MENFGEWLITAVDATSTGSSDLFSKADLYVIIKFAGKIVKTKTIKNQNCPVWKEIFAFPCQKDAISDIEVTVMDNNLLKDDKIGVGRITRNQFPGFGEEREYNIPLSYKNKDVGILHLRVKNDSNDKYFNNNNNNNYGTLSSSATYNNNNNNYNANSSNINRGGYDSTVLGGHSYGGNNQAREVYHTVTETRYVDGQFASPETNLTSNQQNAQYNNNTSLYAPNNGFSNLNSSSTNFNASNKPYNQNTMSLPSNVQNNNLSYNNKQYNKDNLMPTPNPIGSVAAVTGATVIGAAPNITNPTVGTSAITPSPQLPSNAAVTTATTAASSKIRKEKKLRLPEKHHHYDDGYTSSSSESSNEGEKRRMAQQNVGGTDATYQAK